MNKDEMTIMLFKMIEEKSPGAIPLYLTIRGSHSYGTNIPTSDIDFGGVFMQSHDDIIGRNYVEQINDSTNDIVIYELRRFLELCGNNNPNILELLNTTQDCVIYKHPSFDLVLNNKSEFITKQCGDTFGGYAKTQINKAKGQDKKQNWEKDRVVRKSPMDFCYIHLNDKTIPLSNYLELENISQSYCGLSKVPHSKDLYCLYYDKNAELIFNSKFYRLLHGLGIIKTIGYRGISFFNSNELRLSSIPKGSKSIGFITYNKDGYSQHCKDFREYEEWLDKRNEQRWVDVESHGQKIDGKNMMHCYRLAEMSNEIAGGEGVNVKRKNREYLLSIRSGEVDLETLITRVEGMIDEAKSKFRKSNLPDRVSVDLINSLLIKVRKEVYGL